MTAQTLVNNEAISWTFVATFAAIVAVGYAGLEIASLLTSVWAVMTGPRGRGSGQ